MRHLYITTSILYKKKLFVKKKSVDIINLYLYLFYTCTNYYLNIISTVIYLNESNLPDKCYVKNNTDYRRQMHLHFTPYLRNHIKFHHSLNSRNYVDFTTLFPLHKALLKFAYKVSKLHERQRVTKNLGVH